MDKISHVYRVGNFGRTTKQRSPLGVALK